LIDTVRVADEVTRHRVVIARELVEDIDRLDHSLSGLPLESWRLPL
jgi:hypothetical protein